MELGCILFCEGQCSLLLWVSLAGKSPVKSFYQPAADDGENEAGQKLHDHPEHPEIQLVEEVLVLRVIRVDGVSDPAGAVHLHRLLPYLAIKGSPVYRDGGDWIPSCEDYSFETRQ